MKNFFLVVLLSFISFFCFGQQNLSGVIKADNKAVSYATITVGYSENKIKSVRSAVNGSYEIQLSKEDLEKIEWIEVKHISFEISKKDIGNSRIIDFDLLKKANVIEDVVVKSKPKAITKAGDTTRYDVSNFVSHEDESIGDVLRRMPGVEVDENGVVKHNGKTVKRMYVDGDDIFQNGYGVGTRSIKPNAVKRVEMIDNHQHKKIKQDILNSEDVALNLVLTEEARTVWNGEATLGAAIPIAPYLKATAMSFKKKYKTLNTVQYNSIGENIAQDVSQIAAYNIIEPIDASKPPVPTKYYLNNNSFAVNNNDFYRFDENWTASFNANLWADREKLFSTNRQRYFFGNQEDIIYENEFNTIQKPIFVAGNLALEGNSDKFFFKNFVNFKYQKNSNHSWLTDQNQNIDQFGRDRLSYFANNLEFSPLLRNKDQMTFNFSIHKQWQKDNLEILPGVMSSYLNNEKPYDAVNQSLDLPNFETKIGFSYTRTKSKIKQTYFVNGAYEDKELYSELLLKKSNFWSNNENFNDNSIELRHYDFSTGIQLNRKTDNYNVTFSLPFSLRLWEIEKGGNIESNKTSKLIFNPSFATQYYFPNRDYILVNVGFNQSNSDINEMYDNPILRNFRNLSSYNAPLYFKSTFSSMLKYQLERPINFFYANANISHKRSKSDFITAQQVSQNGIITSLVPYDNNVNTTNLSIGASKSFLTSKTVVGLNTNFSSNNYVQVLNNNFADASTYSVSVNPKMEFRKIRSIVLNYSFLYSKSFNDVKSQTERLENKYISTTNEIGILYMLKQGWYMKGSWDYSTFENTANASDKMQNGFVNGMVRYKPFSSKHSFELNINNILNKNSYNSYNLSAYQESSVHIPLRGRQALLKYNFTF